MGGAIREPGYVFTLAEGERGPHRTVVAQHETINTAEDSVRIPLTGHDVPLYEEIDETGRPLK